MFWEYPELCYLVENLLEKVIVLKCVHLDVICGTCKN